MREKKTGGKCHFGGGRPIHDYCRRNHGLLWGMGIKVGNSDETAEGEVSVSRGDKKGAGQPSDDQPLFGRNDTKEKKEHTMQIQNAKVRYRCQKI